jgi:hypothetical protein
MTPEHKSLMQWVAGTLRAALLAHFDLVMRNLEAVEYTTEDVKEAAGEAFRRVRGGFDTETGAILDAQRADIVSSLIKTATSEEPTRGPHLRLV